MNVLIGEGAAAELFRQAGLRFLDQGEVQCQMAYASAEHAWQAHSSTGPTQAAIHTYGEEAVRKAVGDAERAFTRPDGTVLFRNVFLWAAAERPYKAGAGRSPAGVRGVPGILFIPQLAARPRRAATEALTGQHEVVPELVRHRVSHRGVDG